MGNLFADIPQLAGFLLKGPQTSQSKTAPVSSQFDQQIDFESIFKNLVNSPSGSESADIFSPAAIEGKTGSPVPAFTLGLPAPNLFAPLIPMNPTDQTVDNNVEIKQRVEVDSRIIQLCLGNDKDTISILISRDELPELGGFIGDKGLSTITNPFPSVGDNGTQAAIGSSDKANFTQSPKVDKFEQLLETNEAAILTFSPSQLLSGTKGAYGQYIPVTIDKQEYAIQPKAFIQLLAQYPDPIMIDIAAVGGNLIRPEINIARPIVASRDGSSKSTASLTCDLRDLAAADSQPDGQPIKTVLTIGGNAHEYQKISKSLIDKVEDTGSDNIIDNALQAGKSAKPVIEKAMAPMPTPKIVNLESDKIIKDNKPAENNIFPKTTSRPIVSSPDIGDTSIQQSTQTALSSSQPEPYANNEARRHRVLDNLDNSQAPDINLNFAENAGQPGLTVKPDISITGQLDLSPEFAPNIEEIKSGIQKTIENRLTSVNIKLHPAKLGALSIKLVWRPDGLSVDMKADNKEAGRMLNSSIPELKHSLHGANLKVNEINVTVENRNDWAGSGQSAHAFADGNGGNTKHQRGTKTYLKTARHNSSAIGSMTGATSPTIISRGLIDLKA